MASTEVPAPELTDPRDLDLPALWDAFTRHRYPQRGYQQEFLNYLRTLVSDPDAVDDVAFCDHCHGPAWGDTLCAARNDGNTVICEPCWDSWADCECCENRYPPGDLSTTLDESLICDDCGDNYYSYCEVCEGVYYSEDGGHEHDRDCDCVAPQTAFTIRNDGGEPLANDTRITVAMPAGVISGEGLQLIINCLYRTGDAELRQLAFELDPLGNQWQTTTGNYPKRLSSLAYKSRKVKLTPDIMSQVGTIARDHSQPVSVDIEVTRQLNMSACDFGNEGSCWWGEYGASRCALKSNGGFGLRSFSADGRGSYYHEVTGRAWVMPLRMDHGDPPQATGALMPTFDTLTPDAFVVFNGYGDLSDYAAPRIMAQLAGWTYRKISFRCSPMWVNSGGYLIAPENIAQQCDSLQLNVDEHENLFYAEQNNKENAHA